VEAEFWVSLGGSDDRRDENPLTSPLSQSKTGGQRPENTAENLARSTVSRVRAFSKAKKATKEAVEGFYEVFLGALSPFG
jgi:hypothetical protein